MYFVVLSVKGDPTQKLILATFPEKSLGNLALDCRAENSHQGATHNLHSVLIDLTTLWL